MDDQTKLWLTITITITVLLIATLLKSIKRQNSPFKLPPSPPYNLPIVGHLPYILTQPMPHLIFTDLTKTLGPIFCLQMGRVLTVVANSSHWAQVMLKTHDNVFSNRPPLFAAKILSFDCSDVTFSPYGPYWRQARKICVTELLTARRVAEFHRIRVEEVNRLIETLSASSGEEVDLSDKLFQLSNDILCRVAFGRRFTEREDSQKYDIVEVLTETQALLGGFCIGDFFPEWEWVNVVSGMKRRVLRNMEDLRKVCDEIVAEHLRKDRSHSCDEDLVDVLLRVQKKEDLQVEITDDNLKALVLDIFVAGTDTTAAAVEWIMTELFRHPTVMTRTQEEVRRVVSTTGQVSMSHLETMIYMKCVIKETLRLHPPVPLVPRESIEDCYVDGYFIPKRTRIFINSYAIGRDPMSWANPLDFDPSRFLDTNIEVKDQDFRFLPFGGGRRGCPGYAYGLATVELFLANLLYHFNWTLPSNMTADAINLDEIFGLATRKKYPLVLKPTRM